jgi:wyosine [tRNA(Phe)-imidazoG37] synthetase (radical SAM superfamily)
VTVITNGALLPSHAVRQALAEAEVVSIKVDAVREATWRRVNRPHRRLLLDTIRNGMLTFAEGFGGTLLTETMLLGGVNDGVADLRATAAFVGELAPAAAYLTVPLRQTAETWVVPASKAAVDRAVELFRAQVAAVEVLVGRGPAGPAGPPPRRRATRQPGGTAGVPLNRA